MRWPTLKRCVLDWTTRQKSSLQIVPTHIQTLTDESLVVLRQMDKKLDTKKLDKYREWIRATK